MNKIRILLVDDHAMIRAGLQLAVAGQADMEIVGHAASGREAIAQAVACQPHVVLMDVSLPDLSGAEATEAIGHQAADVYVLVFTRHNDPGYLRRLLEAGASGYMLKSAAGAGRTDRARTRRAAPDRLGPQQQRDRGAAWHPHQNRGILQRAGRAKLHLHSRTDIIRYALSQSWLHPDQEP